MELPLHGTTETLLPPEPEAATRRLAEVLDAEPGARAGELRALVAAHPAFLDGWARLADDALAADDPVAAYAFARTGYHRGLDRIRKHGWKGHGPVPWHHEPNRGFLRSVHALMRAAEEIGEAEEAERCRAFLLELDPDDALGAGGSTR
jgi:hypothetical protein